jgi:ubiquinone biosynthesis protein Coq4
MAEAEIRYLQGGREPATSSVLISNSKYLNDPYYRDAFVQNGLRRYGHDLTTTHTVPLMVRAVNEVTDYDEVARLVADEKVKFPEFGGWIDARRRTAYRADDLRDYAEGTLGAAIRAFIEKSGLDINFRKQRPIESDLDYLSERRTTNHDIEHIVTGFGPNAAGEQALAICHAAANSRFFTPALAQFLSLPQCHVSICAYSRAVHHYHAVLPTYFDAMRQGITAGLALRTPLFMVQWEDLLDRQLDDIAADLGFARGPGAQWAWTEEACRG